MGSRLVIGLALAVAALAGAPQAGAAVGDLTQLTGFLGCTIQGSGLDRAPGTSLIQPEAIAVSADGKNAYVASAQSDAVTIFDRDPSTGTITQKPNPDGCVSDDDTSGGTCHAGKGLFFAIDVAVSPDGMNVYVASSEGLSVLNRDPDTGGLSVPTGGPTDGCFTADGSAGTCVAAAGIDSGQAVAVSPDNKNVYVVGDRTLSSFNRDTTTGVITYTGCFKAVGGPASCTPARALDDPRSVTIPSDGKGVYVTAVGSDSIAIFNRDTSGVLTQPPGTAGCASETGADDTGTAGTCKDVNYVSSAFAMAFSSDGRDAYVGDRAQYAIGEFSRDPDTNELTQKPAPYSCLTAASGHPDCGVAKATAYPTGVAVSADGKSVYLSSQDYGVALFDRDPLTGYLTQKADKAGCITDKSMWDSICAHARGLGKPWDIAINPDDKAVYVAAQVTNTVAVFGRETTDSGSSPGTGNPGSGDPGTGDPGTGPPPPPRPPAPSRPHVTTVTVRYNSINGSMSVDATTTGAGTVTMDASGRITVSSGRRVQAAKKVTLKIASAKKTVKKAGKVTLTLKPKGKAKKLLRQLGKLKANLRITFKPKTGKASVKNKKVTFKYKRG